jgi:alkanesulfonate monooxygenase SsuD/methylene tetrahydromethanopterin reductase-like flavin-dependent oxidoreductase (luciferase family)
MDIAIGLPGMIPGVDSATLTEWARRAERRGFSSLIVDDRLVWSGYEILMSAAAAAAVTERIRITVAVVVAPLRTNVALFAKQVATLDQLANGRLVLGFGVGSRQDDFAASAVDFSTRGATTDALLERATAIWRGEAEPIGPKPVSPGGPPLLFGGSAPATFRRIGKYRAGWVCATSGGPDGLRRGRERAELAWEAAGHDGTPRMLALTPRFSLGPGGQEAADTYLRAYNAYRGEGAEQRAATALVRPELVQEQIELFEAAGCDELVINPSNPDPDQVDLLADAIAAG